jgi:soluble lytic murein transglycosylase
MNRLFRRPAATLFGLGLVGALALPSAQAQQSGPLAPSATVQAATQVPAGPLSAQQLSWYRERLKNAQRTVAAAPADPSAVAGLIPDPVAETLMTWSRLRREESTATGTELMAYLMANPGWPTERGIRQRTERTLTPQDNARTRLAFFNQFAPLTATGRLRYAEALSDTGDSGNALAQARAAWTSGALTPTDEALLLSRWGSQLREGDHRDRAYLLMWSGNVSAVRRLQPLLGADMAALVEARLAARAGAPDATAKIAALPEAMKRDAGLVLDRALAVRKASRDDAVRIFTDAAVNPETIRDPGAWLRPRLSLARELLNDDNRDAAYRLLASSRVTAAMVGTDADEDDRIAFVDSEWLAGWIALRQLRQPERAIGHFRAMQGAATSPITLSRAAFWAGRAAEAMNDARAAQTWYGRAAQYDEHFYGQLAAEKLDLAHSPPNMTPPSAVRDRLRALDGDPLVKAIRILGQLDEDTLQSAFINHLAQRARTLDEKRLAADLARELDRLDMGVNIGKLAYRRGMDLGYASYPRVPLAPELQSEWTMVHAITRQESLFNRKAISRAGARGLMQLMPGTAAAVARGLGLPYDAGRLLTDPAYNMTLGATYFRRRVNDLDGSYVLAVASYNAGIGNVRRWLGTNGDPRDPSVDVIDWIERIPFSETRNYVQRVLENAVIYSLIDPNQPAATTSKPLSRYLGLIGAPQRGATAAALPVAPGGQ